MFIWPFFIFVDLAFLKLLMAKFGFLNFFGPGNPVSPAWIIDSRRGISYAGVPKFLDTYLTLRCYVGRYQSLMADCLQRDLLSIFFTSSNGVFFLQWLEESLPKVQGRSQRRLIQKHNTLRWVGRYIICFGSFAKIDL